MWSKLRLSLLVPLAGVVFAGVLYFPDLLASGPMGSTSDLGIGGLLERGSWLGIAAAFGGGLLTALTPCVYPLIPITVSIFGARQARSRLQAMLLSALYVLGIAVTYSALGVAAALTGQAFGTAMSNPLVVVLVAVVLATMAASMFGAFDLALPAGLHARLNTFGGAGIFGSFGMGLVAGVIAAPCTGPVLAAALAVIAQKGSIAYGLGITFPYALGMGLPFFLIGAFSLSFPKSGPWMETVKSVFGVALLAAAGVFLKDAFPALKGLFSAAREAALAAAAAAALGVLAGALTGSFHASWPRRLAKGLGVALLAGGIVYAAGAAGARERARRAEGFAWLHSYPEAIARARAEGRPVIIDFWAEWCVACKELDRLAWSDPRVREEASRFVAVKLDGTDGAPPFEEASEEYAIAGMPTVIFLDARGREVPERVLGAVGADEMLERLRAVGKACERPPPPAPSGALACAARW